MSDSPESKNSTTNLNPSAAPRPAAEPAPTSVRQPNSAPVQPSVPSSAQVHANPVQPQPNATASSQIPTQGPTTQFKAENIGSWAAQQEDYFAEQNRKAEEKRKKSEQTRKKVLPVVFIVGGIIAAGLIIWGIVALIMALTTKPEVDAPTISGGTSEDVNSYRDILQDFFNKGGTNGVQAVEDAVNDTLNTESGREFENQVKLAEIIVLQNNGFYDEAIEKSKNIDMEKLDLDQKISFYGVLYYCSTMLGDNKAANDYFMKQYELSMEQGGEGGGA